MVNVRVVRRKYGTVKLLNKLKRPQNILKDCDDIAYNAIMENFAAEGRSESGAGNQWKPLSPYTIRQRARELGPMYAAHPILVRTGKMKSSVKAYRKQWKIVVSVKDFKAKFHIFGTQKIPQRNFMMIPKPDRQALVETIKRNLLFGL